MRYGLARGLGISFFRWEKRLVFFVPPNAKHQNGDLVNDFILCS